MLLKSVRQGCLRSAGEPEAKAAAAIRTTAAARTTTTTAHTTNKRVEWDGSAVLLYKEINEVSRWTQKREALRVYVCECACVEREEA